MSSHESLAKQMPCGCSLCLYGLRDLSSLNRLGLYLCLSSQAFTVLDFSWVMGNNKLAAKVRFGSKRRKTFTHNFLVEGGNSLYRGPLLQVRQVCVCICPGQPRLNFLSLTAAAGCFSCGWVLQVAFFSQSEKRPLRREPLEGIGSKYDNEGPSRSFQQPINKSTSLYNLVMEETKAGKN